MSVAAVGAVGATSGSSAQLTRLEKQLAADEKALAQDEKAGASQTVRTLDESRVNADVVAIDALLAQQQAAAGSASVPSDSTVVTYA